MKNNIKISLGLLVYAFFMACTEDSIRDVNVMNMTFNNQYMGVKRVPKENSCKGCFGKDFNECMKYLLDESFRLNIAEMSVRSLRCYLLSLSIEEYESVLSRFTETQWSNVLAQFSEAERKCLPKTKAEQLCIIRDVYYEYYNQDCWINASKKEDMSDLVEFKKFCIQAGISNEALNRNLALRREKAFNDLYKK